MEIIKEGYTRVTEILSIFQAYSFVPRDTLRKAQERGTLIHEAIENFFASEFYPLPPKMQGYFDSFLAWYDSFSPKKIACEKRLYHDSWKITGKFDLLADIYGEPVLIDFKTGSWTHPKIWEMQMGFYHLLAKETGLDPMPTKSMVVHIKEHTPPAIYPFIFSDDTKKVCEQALELWKYFNK